MRSTYTHNNLTWIDLEQPTREEVLAIMEEYHLSHMVAEELLLPTTKARIEFYDGFIYLVLHFPSLRRNRTFEQEIDFIVGRNYIITTRYESIDSLHQFSKAFEVDSLLKGGEIAKSVGVLFFYMMKRLYKSVLDEVEHVRDGMGEIEKAIFMGKEKEMVEQISVSGRDLLNLRQTIEPHRDVLQRLETDAPRFLGNDVIPYLRTVSNDYYRVHSRIMRLIESLHELRETNNSLLTTKQNETMRTLTIMALLTFPLSLFVSILDVETEHNPIRGLPYDFWIIVFLVAAGAALMLWYFHHKKWL